MRTRGVGIVQKYADAFRFSSKGEFVFGKDGIAVCVDGGDLRCDMPCAQRVCCHPERFYRSGRNGEGIALENGEVCISGQKKVILTSWMMKRKDTVQIFDKPEVKGVNGVLREQKPIRMGAKRNGDAFSGCNPTFFAPDVNGVEKLGRQRVRVKGAHNAASHKGDALPVRVWWACDLDAVVGLKCLIPVAVLADVVEDPQVSTGPKSTVRCPVVEPEIHGTADLKPAGGGCPESTVGRVDVSHLTFLNCCRVFAHRLFVRACDARGRFV